MCAHNIKDAGVNKSSESLWISTNSLNMEAIKLQCISSVELKDAIETSQIKTQLG